ncbi:mucin-2-like [Huso huso]|uniref:chitinase n=1 Tax=Huso huso TaxID=61971 RepID=A0ABR0YD12_HUSHU
MVFDQKVLNCVVPPAPSSPTPTLSKTTNTPKLYNSNFCVNKPSSLYADPEDLTGFYQCENELTYYFTCLEGMVFDQKVLNCVVPPAASSPALTLSETTTTPKLYNSNFCVNKPSLLYADPEDRTGFYRCENEVTFYFTCLEGMVFDQKVLNCVVPPAPSSPTPTLSKTTNTPKLYNSDFCINKPSLLYADPEDLTGFYQCENELTYYFTCLEGMVFDQKVLNCVVPPAASSPALTLSETTTTPKLYNSNFCVNKPSLLYADPEDLTGFYRCENEVTFYFTCHEGMVFDQKVLNCVVPLPAPSPGFCILKPNGIYRDPGNRAGFYVCVKRRPFYKTCPTPLVFNPELLICDYLSGTHS